MTDSATPARVLLARLIKANERITRAASHKSIPEWVSRSIKETAAEADKTIEILRGLIEPDHASESPNG